MVIIKTNQTSLVIEMDLSKEWRKKNPFGINGLRINFDHQYSDKYLNLCFEFFTVTLDDETFDFDLPVTPVTSSDR